MPSKTFCPPVQNAAPFEVAASAMLQKEFSCVAVVFLMRLNIPPGDAEVVGDREAGEGEAGCASALSVAGTESRALTGAASVPV